MSLSPLLSVIVGQYVWGGDADSDQMGGMKGLDYKYRDNRPIELNETAYFPAWYVNTDPIAASRVEAWEFMVGGGASFNHLNSRFTAADPTGNSPDSLQVMAALRHLRDFLNRFDFVRMHADISFVVSGVPAGAYCRGMSEPGEQYALYHHHSDLDPGQMYYIARPGQYREMLILELPAGTYREDWVDPASGAVIRSGTFTHQGGKKEFDTPEHDVDMALRIKRTR